MPRRGILRAVPTTTPERGPSAYYLAPVPDFLAADSNEILGELASAHGFALDPEQRDAWQQEILILRGALAKIPGTLYLEFEVPRLGSRIDAVVLTGPAIIPIEFKCGETRYLTADYNQAWDYALDLKNFHQASHDAPIFPLLVATDAPSSDSSLAPTSSDGVRAPCRCRAADLAAVVAEIRDSASGAPLDGGAWGSAPYHPTPTIIEAARALYARHTVQDISRHDAGATNLRVTSAAIEEIVESSRTNRRKAIIFLTGVPGAGKTLVGLNIATRRRNAGETRAVFLSGNGPLVTVLREALTRDELARRPGMRKGRIRQEVKPFIQNVHHFRDDGVRDPRSAPGEHVVIFDEAQRAWNRWKTADFMKRRKRIPGFTQSEPEFLISYLDRHDEWAVVICLVGGGQEIHTGEAGIGEWLDAVHRSFRHWQVYVSPDLCGSEYAAAAAIETLRADRHLVPDQRLHLATSMRSFRSERVSAFVRALLDLEQHAARCLLADVLRKYPIAITRDLAKAKQWVRTKARGSERFGLVASSQAQRLKPHAIDVRVNVDPVHWFLNDRDDTRSSFYLEDAATEFQIQGLELDWICVTWDADLRLDGDEWRYHAFRGSRWISIRKEDAQRYLLNAYRVLLTRARQGMVIFVPPGDSADDTRRPCYYDGTYEYLAGLGLAVL